MASEEHRQNILCRPYEPQGERTLKHTTFNVHPNTSTTFNNHKSLLVELQALLIRKRRFFCTYERFEPNLMALLAAISSSRASKAPSTLKVLDICSFGLCFLSKRVLPHLPSNSFFLSGETYTSLGLSTSLLEGLGVFLILACRRRCRERDR